MDDLKSIIEYHEQVLRSLENQIGQLFESRQEFEDMIKQDRAEAKLRAQQSDLSMKQFDRRMDRLEAFMARAFRLGVVAARRERVRRQQEERRRHEGDQWLTKQDRRLEKQIAESRAEWEKKVARIEEQRARDLAASDKRMTRVGTTLERFLRGLQGSNGKAGPLPSEA